MSQVTHHVMVYNSKILKMNVLSERDMLHHSLPIMELYSCIKEKECSSCSDMEYPKRLSGKNQR